MTKLTTSKFWDKIWSNSKSSRVVDTKDYTVRRFHELFKKVLPYDKKYRIIEIGCAPGRWLLYFNHYYGYQLFGIEYSPVGYKQTIENLSVSGVGGEIANVDFFAEKPFKDKMNVVFSAGFIEHFENTEDVIKRHLNYMADDGFLIIVIPNIRGFYGFLQSIVDREVYLLHKKLELSNLRNIFKKLGIREISSGYFGTFNLGLVNWSNVSMFFKCVINRTNKIIQGMFDVCGLIIESGIFSPYIVYIGRKKS